MRRTLLAVGVALLVSMLLAPHASRGTAGIQGVGVFWSLYGLKTSDFSYGLIGRVMIDMLALEIAFLGVLAALVVNLPPLPPVARRWLLPATVAASVIASILAMDYLSDLARLIVFFFLCSFVLWFVGRCLKHRKG